MDSLLRRRHLEDIVDTDTAYFEAGAESSRGNGFTLVRTPGLEHLAAGCLAVRVEPPATEEGARRWRLDFEGAVHLAGGHRYRLYLTDRAPALETELLAHGYARRFESMLVRDPERAPRGSTRVRLREITSASGWAEKVRVDGGSTHAPDGHRVDTRSWAEYEHRKWRSGIIRYFLVDGADETCGTVGVVRSATVVRVKNLLLHPGWRGLGIATEVALAVHATASATGLPAGLFAAAGGIAERAYRRAGFRVVGTVTEFVREPGGRGPAGIPTDRKGRS
ncbi:GNAT family N-acetyltransferase [Saccharothrix syringae]|uniref:GNAT family N-acetyltransferase n=1 Tax=Saccharothrix syringae TaxID=103733 RepID=A0A5Q0H3S0_SACSY|nr:GNAT family N-acetyltransferase [Saccharothrix syringae]QFZ20858.1 GNAT family N-acetyltransferase [Saccharothrix syringae]